MDIGMMRYRFSVLADNSTTLTSRGQITAGSTEAASIRGSLERLRGTDGVLAQQQFPTATHKIKSWKPRPTAIVRDHKLTYAGRTFFINDIDDLQAMGQEYHLIVTEEL